MIRIMRTRKKGRTKRSRRTRSGRKIRRTRGIRRRRRTRSTGRTGKMRITRRTRKTRRTRRTRRRRRTRRTRRTRGRTGEKKTRRISRQGGQVPGIIKSRFRICGLDPLDIIEEGGRKQEKNKKNRRQIAQACWTSLPMGDETTMPAATPASAPSAVERRRGLKSTNKTTGNDGVTKGNVTTGAGKSGAPKGKGTGRSSLFPERKNLESNKRKQQAD